MRKETLNNETILKLVEAGISDDTIVGMVYQQAGRYALSADDIAALKSGGVSERIIAALVIKGGSSATNTTSWLTSPTALEGPRRVRPLHRHRQGAGSRQAASPAQ